MGRQAFGVFYAILCKVGEKIKIYNESKSMPRDRLLGHMDMDTREWFDGVLTDAARKVKGTDGPFLDCLRW